MVRLFISQPMRDKTDEQILKERKRAIAAAEEIIGEPIEVIDSFFKNTSANMNPLWLLGRSIEFLSSANVVYFVKGWQEARGCRIEERCAKEYGILPLYET